MRVRAAGSRAVQIETGDACHLDAVAVSRAVDQLDLAGSPVRVVVIKNVGNLICPSGYDLGEALKSVTSPAASSGQPENTAERSQAVYRPPCANHSGSGHVHGDEGGIHGIIFWIAPV